MQHAILILLFLSLSFNHYAQSIGKFGKPTLKELASKESSIDKEAEAEFILNSCDIDFGYSQEDGFVLQKKVRKKLKIYNKDKAADWATVIIALYKEEEHSRIRVLTHNLEGGKVVTEKIDQKDIFEEKSSENWTNLRFTFPNVQDGSILELEYTITSPYLWNLGTWYFQYSIPVQYSSYNMDIPEYFQYQPHLFGYQPITEVIKDNGIGSINTQGNIQNYTTNITKYIYRNIPALNKEPFVFNINNYRNSIRYELASITYPMKPVHNYSKSWESIAHKLMIDDDFGLQLSRSNYLNKQWETLKPQLEGKAKKEQCKLLFDYVRNTIKWNKKRSLVSQKGAKKAFEEKEGNSAELNFILIALLRKAGLQANPLTLSTIDNGMINYAFPSLTQLNYVITAIEDGDKTYLIDAAHKYSNINNLPFYCSNYRGFIVYDEGYKEINISNSPQIDLVTIVSKINEEGAIEGNYSKSEFGHTTLERRKNLEVSEEEVIKKIQIAKGDIEKQNISFQNAANINAPLVTKFNFVDDTDVQKIGSKLFVNALLFMGQLDNPFKNEKRLFPVEIGNKIQENYQITIELPDTYELEYVPQSVLFKLPDNLGKYFFSVENLENKITITRRFKLNKSIYTIEESEVLRELFMKIVEIENDKLILNKKK